MSSYQIIEKLKLALTVLNSTELPDYLERITFCQDEIMRLGEPEAQKRITQDLMNRMKPGKVFGLIDVLRKTIYEDFLESHQENFEVEPGDEFEEFENVYENFIINSKTPLSNSLIRLAFSAKMLHASLKSYRNLFRGILFSLEKSKEHDPSLKEISFYFEDNYPLEEVLIKLAAIQKLYSEMCSLMNISEDDFPLEINEIESGSLFIKLLGEPKVIESLLSLIKDSIGFFYRTRTNEGRIESISSKVEAINTVIKLKENLEKNGIDTNDLEERLQSSALVIAEQLESLIAGERKIEMNGEIISSNRKTSQKLLSGKKPYLLEGSEEKDETEIKSESPQN